MTACEVPDSVPGQEEYGSRLPGCMTHLSDSVLLVGGEPVFQKIDVISHFVSCFRRLKTLPSI